MTEEKDKFVIEIHETLIALENVIRHLDVAGYGGDNFQMIRLQILQFLQVAKSTFNNKMAEDVASLKKYRAEHPEKYAELL